MGLTIALIADIHGNLAALDAVLDALQAKPSDQIICLGDVAATGPQPREVLRRLRELGCPVVMGNADAELLDMPPSGTETDEESLRIADISRWGAAQLDEADRAFLSLVSTDRGDLAWGSEKPPLLPRFAAQLRRRHRGRDT